MFTKQEQITVFFLSSAILVGSVFNFVNKRSTSLEFILEFLNKNRFISSVDVNTASKEQLVSVPYIGQARASYLLEYRRSKKIDSCSEIPGIIRAGGEAYERMRMFLKVGKKECRR